MKNKILIVCVCALAAASVFARPHGCHRVPHRAPAHHVFHGHHGHHHGSHRHWIGPAIVGGTILGAAVVNAFTQPTVVAPAPVVVTPAPVVAPAPTVIQTQTKVWVPGHYQTRVVNGIVVQDYVPGRYEWR
jgi:hypothetical protein